MQEETVKKPKIPFRELTTAKKVKRVLCIVASALTTVLLLLAIIIAGIAVTAKIQKKPASIFGQTYHLVLTASMTPEIPVDCLVTAKPIAIEDVKEKDVVLFKWTADEPKNLKGQIVIHRVKELIKDKDGTIIALKTKGDANPDPDEPLVTKENLFGIRTGQSRFMGAISKFLSQPINFLFLLGIAILLYLMYYLIKSIVKQLIVVKKGGIHEEKTTVDRDRLEAEIRAEYGLPEREIQERTESREQRAENRE